MMRTGTVAAVAAMVAACGDPTGPADVLDWPVATPAEAGLDGGLVDAAVTRVRDSLANVNAFLVVRGGALVREEYFHGSGRSTLHLTRSVTKAVTATMAGVALARGWIDSLDQPLHTLLPASLTADLDDVRKQITVRHLLTMRSGLTIDPDGDGLGVEEYLGAGDFWVRSMLYAPLWAAPGSGYRYDSSNPHLVSAVITAQTGFSMEDAAATMLFEPLGVDAWSWDRDPQGFTIGSTGLYMTAQDLAKLGELYLRDGVWNGTRILPPGWAATAATGYSDVVDGLRYGFQWWEITWLPTPAYAALGFREQYVIVLPALDLVVVIASESVDLREPVEDHFHLVTRYLLPAAGVQ